ncbi:MAG: LysR family transcriptional regulator [Pirellulales bacterium]
MANLQSLSTDQIAAFVEVARQGSLRAAAEVLFVTEQGVRSRLLALEKRLGVELYRKSRGMRRATPLTPQGKLLLPKAIAFLERAQELTELFASEPRVREVHVVASQYLLAYALIDVAWQFHARFPEIRVRLSARTEQEIENELLENPDVMIGVAAPYESSPDLIYAHLFSMDWSLIAPQRHPLSAIENLRLADVVDAPLILYERGSTGRQHVIQAFARLGLSPRVEMEVTTTNLIVRMVEAGLGVGIVPLMPSGAVTRGHRLAVRSLGQQIRAIDSGVLVRKGELLAEAPRTFVEFIKSHDFSAKQP